MKTDNSRERRLDAFTSDLHAWLWGVGPISDYFPELYAKVQELAHKHRITVIPPNEELL